MLHCTIASFYPLDLFSDVFGLTPNSKINEIVDLEGSRSTEQSPCKTFGCLTCECVQKNWGDSDKSKTESAMNCLQVKQRITQD